MNEAAFLSKRIVPCPKEFSLTGSGKLCLTQDSVIRLVCPDTLDETGKIAARKLTTYLTNHCPRGGIANEGDVVITLALDTAPMDGKAAHEGYRLTVEESCVTITGFSQVGLMYGVTTFLQLLKWDIRGAVLPALQVLDWPDNPMRGLTIESRYGSNLMEKKDWFAMVDSLADRKLNTLRITLYGCWQIQYDGRISEYCYLPLAKYPQLNTPMTVRYYSPTEEKWVDYETLPPIYRDDFFGELVSYAKARGISIIPGWNSYGHNTLVPRMLPETSAKEEDGTPAKTGFCTSNEKTYEFLFGLYDEIIDKYLLPNGLTAFCLTLDEVHDQTGQDMSDPRKICHPWCQCEKCREKTKQELFVDHVIRLATHLKNKGMKTISICHDMLLQSTDKVFGLNCADMLRDAIFAAGLEDVIIVTWWAYTDVPETKRFTSLRPELGLRRIAAPMTGYYHWSLLTHTLINIQDMAHYNHRDGGEGVIAYSSWDRSYDRAYDALADYAWGFDQAGTPEDVTARYALRRFGPHAQEAAYATYLMEQITRQSSDKNTIPTSNAVNNFLFMLHRLGYYTYSYPYADRKYPRPFPGEGIEKILENRVGVERMLAQNIAMAQQAMDIFTRLASEPDCDGIMAKEFACACENYLCMCQDWQAILQMYDWGMTADCKKIAPLAAQRRDARLRLMKTCESAREKFVLEALTMRNHSIFMQMFADIADYVERTENPQVNMLESDYMMSSQFWRLR